MGINLNIEKLSRFLIPTISLYILIKLQFVLAKHFITANYLGGVE
jgi:hypothetical protein